MFTMVFLGAVGVSSGPPHFLPNHAVIMTFLKENIFFCVATMLGRIDMYI